MTPSSVSEVVRSWKQTCHLRSTKPLRVNVHPCSEALTLYTLHTVLEITCTILSDSDAHIGRMEARLSFMLDLDWKCAYGARTITV
jgi:hypothetical protein